MFKDKKVMTFSIKSSQYDLTFLRILVDGNIKLNIKRIEKRWNQRM